MFVIMFWNKCILVTLSYTVNDSEHSRLSCDTGGASYYPLIPPPTMLSRISRNAALKSQRACSVSTCETRRKFVQPSSLNKASVIDPPPAALQDHESLFRPKSGRKLDFLLTLRCKFLLSDMLGFTLGKRESTEKARPIYLDFQVCRTKPNLKCFTQYSHNFVGYHAYGSSCFRQDATVYDRSIWQPPQPYSCIWLGSREGCRRSTTGS